MDDLFEDVIEFPDPEAQELFNSLVGLDEFKEHLCRQVSVKLFPADLEKWWSVHHNGKSTLLSYLSKRPPLYIFAGDVGTGKTALARTFGDSIARSSKGTVKLFSISLNARGSGAVGEMTRLIGAAFDKIKQEARSTRNGRVGYILMIDEADSLAQSREFAQMHHEDRAGVNALIRGIDDFAASAIPVAVVMCTNRMLAIDPAVQRRAALIHFFERPNFEHRRRLMQNAFSGLGFSEKDIERFAHDTGEEGKHELRYTFSDITQRLFPKIIFSCFPESAITAEVVTKAIAETKPTTSFNELRT